MIPIVDLTAQYRDLKPAIDAAVGAVLASGQFVLGPNVSALEGEIAAYVGTAHAVALNSGTDALYAALRALDIGPGDEVITSPFSFAATSEAVCMVGAQPVFVDIDSTTFNVDPTLIEAAITRRTQAILAVHLYGLPAAMGAIRDIARRKGLAVIEDCAQAFGADLDGRKVGSFGQAGCFSFFPTKTLGAFGDGGMLTTNSASVADFVRSLRAHGSRAKYVHEMLGINSRLDEIQAAILRVKLPHVDTWIAARRRIAKQYTRGLGDLPGVTVPIEQPGMAHAYHQYTIRSQRRDAIQRQLDFAGVQSIVYYPRPLHLQAVHRDLGYLPGAFPEAEAAAREVLSLPMYPELPAGEQQLVIDGVSNAVRVGVPA